MAMTQPQLISSVFVVHYAAGPVCSRRALHEVCPVLDEYMVSCCTPTEKTVPWRVWLVARTVYDRYRIPPMIPGVLEIVELGDVLLGVE